MIPSLIFCSAIQDNRDRSEQDGNEDFEVQRNAKQRGTGKGRQEHLASVGELLEDDIQISEEQRRGKATEGSQGDQKPHKWSYACVCVCVCVTTTTNKRERERER